MKIVRLTAENVKRLVAVQVEPDPDGNLVIVSGRNGQGKSSLLDAIFLALGGSAAGKDTPQPIRHGEDRARVTLDLGDLRVTRTWRNDRTELRVENRDGARYASPQTMLDHLVGRLSFDPLAFAGQDPRTQRATLLQLIDLPGSLDLDELDRERADLFSERTDLSRDRKRLDAQVAGMPEPTVDLPDAEVSTADLIREYAGVRAQHQLNTDRRRDLERAEDLVSNREQTVEMRHRELQEAEKAAADGRRQLDERQQAVDEIEEVDLTGYEQRVADAEQVNAGVRAAHTYRDTARLRDIAAAEVDKLTVAIAEIDQRKARALHEARMPIDGLAVDEHGVTYRGVPFGQCSSAEQLRVSLAMAMALNPRLRVIRITDGSLLDSENLRLIEQMAADRDYQVWVERVDETGQVGVVIEDGMVVPPRPSSADDPAANSTATVSLA